MVRCHVEAFADAALRIHRAAGIAGVHHGGDARDIGAEGQNFQIEHELEVIVEGFGDPHRRLGQFQTGRHLGFRLLNPALDFAHVIEIFREFGTVGKRKIALERSDLVHHRVEQAAA